MFGIFGLLKSQIKSTGTPDVYNFTSKSYSYITQTTSITQDTTGIMYFATTDGFLIFDGNQWEHQYSTNGSVVRSIYTSHNGKVYLGSYNDFGYLEPDKNGTLMYHSLLNKLKPEHQNFGDIWRIFEIDNKIIFQSFDGIFILEGNNITSFYPVTKFEFSFVVNGKYYVLDKDKGMLLYLNHEFIDIPEAKKFLNLNVWQLLSIDKEKILVATESEGLLIYDGKTLEPWKVKISEILKKYRIISATTVFGKYYVFGTLQNGIYVIDQNGNLVQHINKHKGLQSNCVISLFIDINNNLWIGNDLGIDYTTIANPITWFDNRNEIQGIVFSIAKFSSKLYISTNAGVYFNQWNDENDINSDFNLVEASNGTSWKLTSINDMLFCGHNEGTFLINGDQSVKISDINGGWIFWTDQEYPGYIFEGTYEGILVYEIKNSKAVFRNKIAGFSESSRIVLKDSDGFYWILHPYNGAYKVKFNSNLTGLSDYTFYSVAKGCPQNIYGYMMNGDIIFSSPTGIYSFDRKTDRFIKDEKHSRLFGDDGQVFGITSDTRGNIWYIRNKKAYFLQKTQNGYRHLDYPSLNRLNGLFPGGFECIYIIDSTNIFLGTSKGVAHFNPTLSGYQNQTFNVAIRKVISTRNDSVLFNCNGDQNITLPYHMNAIYFKFSAPYYELMDNINFRYRLKGFESEWSSWTEKANKEYTNLSEGKYTFEVVARNYMEQESSLTQYTFTILPPWYRSKFAYIAYIFSILFFVWLSIKLIIQIFDKQKIRLEREKHSAIEKKEREHNEELLHAEMEKKKAELAAIAMQISIKNDALIKVIESLHAIAPKLDQDAQKHIEEIILSIQNNINLDSEWDKFLDYFNHVHENFIQKLKSRYPDLTTTDLKLCAYLRMQLSTKEMASMMNISVRGVEKARYRLRKKINLDTDSDLSEFIISITI